tara:strand:+ start:260 stop:475 length:216 start_codon:yes stop_codon:yes gene_type:complete
MKFKKNFPKIIQFHAAFIYASVKPKIRFKENLTNNFLIEDGLVENLTTLTEIESPGLTASLSIASHLYENS